MQHRLKQFSNLNWFTLNPRLTTALFFTCLVAIISFVIYQRFKIIEENRRTDLAMKLETVDTRLSQLFTNTQNIALTMALTLDHQGKPQNFDGIAAEIVTANPIVQALQVLTRGKISHVYPLKGNEKTLGLNLFKTTKYNSLEAQEAIKRRKMYFQGPMKMVQGNMGVVGRLPIFRNNSFWGFSAVVINLDSLLKAAGIDNNHSFYKFQFSKVNLATGVEEFFMGGDTDFSKHIHKTKIIEEGDWKIHLKDTRSIYADSTLQSLGILGVFFTTLSGILLLRVLTKQLQLHLLIKNQFDELIVAENKYKGIFDKAAIGIGRVDSITGKFIEANVFLCELLGYTAAELTQSKINSLIHADDFAPYAKSFKNLIAGEIREFSLVIRYITKDKEVIWANAIVSPLWGEGEKPSNHLVIIHDISQQVAHEAQLVASQKHIEELINSIEGIVWEASIDEGYANSFISNKVFEILGYTQEEATNSVNFIFDHIYEEDKQGIADYVAKELFTKRHHVYEYRIVAKDGSLIWIRDSLSIEPSLDSPKKLRGIMMDITSVKEAEETLQKSFELVNEQNKRLLNFSYIVSHNLRSHASNIDGITSLISNAETDAERDQMIVLLQKVVKNLNDTLYNLNKIVDVQTALNLTKEPLNLREYLDNALRTQETYLLQSRAEVITKVSTDVQVIFNKAYLESVLLNLISNAIRYSHPARKAMIEINCGSTPDGVLLSVKDNGVGIDLAKNGSKLFGLNQTFYGNSGARGFGLFITKNQVEAMGGNIQVESELGKGATFRILFKNC